MRQITLALVLLAVWSAPAAAEEPDAAAALLTKIAELRKAEDAAALAKAVGEVPAVYKDEANKGTRGSFRAELGKVLKDDDLGEARSAAVAALVALEDPKSAWKVLSRHLPSHKTEKAAPFDLEVVKAAGSLAQSRAVKPLSELAYKAKDPALAAGAVEALGGYREDVKGRVKILEELIAIGKRTRPGRSTEKAVSKEAQERWAAVGPVLVRALNHLTGRGLSSFEDWELLWDEYKKRPKLIFVEE